MIDNLDLPKDSETDRKFATTLARGLSVLRAFRVSDDGLGNAEISDRTNLPKSTVSRLTYTLHSLGYLSHARHRDRYRPGPALLALGNVASSSISFFDLSEPLMQRLADETGTLALLLVRDRQKMLIVKTWRPRTVASIWLEAGQRLPFCGTSSGHAMLASLSETGFSQTVAEADSNTNMTQERAEQARNDARHQLMTSGFVVTDPEHYFTPSIHAVAVPFHSRDLGEPVIFTCGAMPEVLSIPRLHSVVGPKLHATIRELERIMGQGSSLANREL